MLFVAFSILSHSMYIDRFVGCYLWWINWMLLTISHHRHTLKSIVCYFCLIFSCFFSRFHVHALNHNLTLVLIYAPNVCIRNNIRIFNRNKKCEEVAAFKWRKRRKTNNKDNWRENNSVIQWALRWGTRWSAVISTLTALLHFIMAHNSIISEINVEKSTFMKFV